MRHDRRQRSDLVDGNFGVTICFQDDILMDKELQELQQRNLQRAKEAIERMGNKYLCHPDNRVKRLPPKQILKGNV